MLWAPPTPRGRLLVANLDAELSWARTRLGCHARLPERVVRATAAAGAAMSVFAHPGDRLWLPATVEVDRIAEPLRANVELVTGELPPLPRALFPWAATAEVCDETTASLAAELNDRRTSVALERELACALPDVRVLTGWSEVANALTDWPHPRPWVLKAPLSASGRSRLKRRGLPERDALVRARRLVDRFGVLILEPWVERRADYGTTGWIRDSGVSELSSHELDVEGNGVFRAAIIGKTVPGRVTEIAQAVGVALFERGYRGPFGVDSFTHGDDQLRPLCEINARLTFGHVAREAIRRFGESLGGSPCWRFEIHRSNQLHEDAFALVRAGAHDPTAVTLRSASPT